MRANSSHSVNGLDHNRFLLHVSTLPATDSDDHVVAARRKMELVEDLKNLPGLYHITDGTALNSMMARGNRPGGHASEEAHARNMVHLTPWAPWGRRRSEAEDLNLSIGREKGNGMLLN